MVAKCFTVEKLFLCKIIFLREDKIGWNDGFNHKMTSFPVKAQAKFK